MFIKFRKLGSGNILNNASNKNSASFVLTIGELFSLLNPIAKFHVSQSLNYFRNKN